MSKGSGGNFSTAWLPPRANTALGIVNPARNSAPVRTPQQDPSPKTTDFSIMIGGEGGVSEERRSSPEYAAWYYAQNPRDPRAPPPLIQGGRYGSAAVRSVIAPNPAPTTNNTHQNGVGVAAAPATNNDQPKRYVAPGKVGRGVTLKAPPSAKTSTQAPSAPSAFMNTHPVVAPSTVAPQQLPSSATIATQLVPPAANHALSLSIPDGEEPWSDEDDVSNRPTRNNSKSNSRHDGARTYQSPNIVPIQVISSNQPRSDNYLAAFAHPQHQQQPLPHIYNQYGLQEHGSGRSIPGASFSNSGDPRSSPDFVPAAINEALSEVLRDGDDDIGMSMKSSSYGAGGQVSFGQTMGGGNSFTPYPHPHAHHSQQQVRYDMPPMGPTQGGFSQQPSMYTVAPQHSMSMNYSAMYGSPLQLAGYYPDMQSNIYGAENADMSARGRGGRGGGRGNSRGGRHDYNQQQQVATGVAPPTPFVERFTDEHVTGGWGIEAVFGHVRDIAKDQEGSRFIQLQLESAHHRGQLKPVLDRVVSEIFLNSGTATEVITDIFGNYVVQKILDMADVSQLTMILKSVESCIVPLTLQTYGCRVIQKAVEVVHAKGLNAMVDSILHELRDNVARCVQDQNGNHVIQKCIEIVPGKSAFIIDAFKGRVRELATHAYGCRVIQCILAQCPNREDGIMAEIFQSLPALTKDQYGNYVVQHILQHGSNEHVAIVFDALKYQVYQCSQHKFASNVMEKLYHRANTNQRRELFAILSEPDTDTPCQEQLNQRIAGKPLLSCFVLMMMDPFANYVVQKIVDESDEGLRKAMMAHMSLYLDVLKVHHFGKHIVARFERMRYTGGGGGGGVSPTNHINQGPKHFSGRGGGGYQEDTHHAPRGGGRGRGSHRGGGSRGRGGPYRGGN